MLPEFVALSDGNENDRVQGRKFTFPAGSIVAFYQGYNDYRWFGQPTKQGVSFVTRLRPNAVYKVLERKSVDKRKGITSGQRYTFLTNNFSFCAATIAAIYKDRWQVDLFFKAIKQNLKIKAFVGSSRNAILTQTCYLP
jgi:putative transposase